MCESISGRHRVDVALSSLFSDRDNASSQTLCFGISFSTRLVLLADVRILVAIIGL